MPIEYVSPKSRSALKKLFKVAKEDSIARNEFLAMAAQNVSLTGIRQIDYFGRQEAYVDMARSRGSRPGEDTLCCHGNPEHPTISALNGGIYRPELALFPGFFDMQYGDAESLLFAHYGAHAKLLLEPEYKHVRTNSIIYAKNVIDATASGEITLSPPVQDMITAMYNEPVSRWAALIAERRENKKFETVPFEAMLVFITEMDKKKKYRSVEEMTALHAQLGCKLSRSYRATLQDRLDYAISHTEDIKTFKDALSEAKRR